MGKKNICNLSLLTLFFLVLAACSNRPVVMQSTGVAALPSAGEGSVVDTAINVRALTRRMKDYKQSKWSASENAYVFYAGRILIARFDEAQGQLTLTPDPVVEGAEACQYAVGDAVDVKNEDLSGCNALLAQLNRLIP